MSGAIEKSIDEMTTVQKLKLLVEYAPLLLRLNRVTSAATPEARSAAVGDLLRWVSGRSETKADDEATRHIEAILNTREGTAGLDWLLNRLRGDA